jgi:hypothetical protein
MEAGTFPLRRLAACGWGRHTSPVATAELQSALAQFVAFAKQSERRQTARGEGYYDLDTGKVEWTAK